MEDSVLYHFATVKQTRSNREDIQYDLQLRQQPKRSRMCGVGEKADRRPIDPPPIVQLKVNDPNLPSSDQHSFLQNPYYFMYASLMAADLDEELHLLRDGKTRSTTGSVVSSLYHLKDIDNSDAGFFVFPDLSVRVEGHYRLKLSLFEIIGKDVYHCRSIISDVFVVYSAKKFPGMEESTFLSRAFADQGLKIRIRKELRQRKKNSRRKEPEDDSSMLSVEDKSSKRVRNDEHSILEPSGSEGSPASGSRTPAGGSGSGDLNMYQQPKSYTYPPSSSSSSYQQQSSDRMLASVTSSSNNSSNIPPTHPPHHHQHHHPSALSIATASISTTSSSTSPTAPIVASSTPSSHFSPQSSNPVDARYQNMRIDYPSMPLPAPPQQPGLVRHYADLTSSTDASKISSATHHHPVRPWSDSNITTDFQWRRSNDDRAYEYNDLSAAAAAAAAAQQQQHHHRISSRPTDHRTVAGIPGNEGVAAAAPQQQSLLYTTQQPRYSVTPDSYYSPVSPFARPPTETQAPYSALHHSHMSASAPSTPNSGSGGPSHPPPPPPPPHSSRNPPMPGFVERPQPQRAPNINSLLTDMRIEHRDRQE
ncbi:related to velvet a protein [Lichtheimia corymbifera JMRC:FSU:9682]|uniref:Related to velvet a protein n=1 Tax=Lichtheimia corymbifera JMRC:FSU:9682 TaxID=1263082 RepID=A0A068RYD5_9FUNG|nr:related to velvet a protein [Lichtheimia corymbifera JMRC:FSU:9682]